MDITSAETKATYDEIGYICSGSESDSPRRGAVDGAAGLKIIFRKERWKL